MPRAGFVASATMPARPAKAYMLPTTASTRLAWKRVPDDDECSPASCSRVSLSALVVPSEARNGLERSDRTRRSLCLAFGTHVVGHKPIRQLRHGGSAAFGTLC